ncbi:rCG29047, isoform CRA_a [Rattus norvegicus]|uniref:RCG29047, isoform CRA_a n=1 Tax=Rattus norvegicus TaxID=10116 RepID=A6HUX2_RAT|nr:rCG29047, isoform CRA_a [Rattus norvegicus]
MKKARVQRDCTEQQGLKKISAYMKSSHYLSTPIFSKLAQWSNK